MLDVRTFSTIVENTPLVSIDICLVFDDQLLLAKRSNEPLKGQWFTPGGRIFKNESWQNCLKRVAQNELGLVRDDITNFKLMGVWDHFYPNSSLGSEISTHYVNLPHFCYVEEKPKLSLDEQHNEFAWFELKNIISNTGLNKYVRTYASWLIQRINFND